jgi:hypothetical protein
VVDPRKPWDAEQLEARQAIAPIAQKQHVISNTVLYDNPRSYDVDFSSSKRQIPAFLESIETLKCIGFSAMIADSLFRGWKNAVAHHPQIEIEDDFFTFVTNIIAKSQDDAEGAVRDWVRVMRGWAVEQELIGKIVDPRPTITLARLSQSEQYWVLEAMRLRYGSLTRMQKESRDRERRLLGGRGSRTSQRQA